MDVTSVQRGAGPLTGHVVHGHVLGDHLGSGGFAEVYRMDEAGAESVAVKAVRRDKVRPDRVDAEIEHLNVAEHPNVVRYLWHEPGEGPLRQYMFIATELCVRSLEDEFADLPPGPDRTAHAWTVVPRVANDALAGLGHLHGLTPKMIHRDIKPGNILVAPSGVWRVADFGIARLLGQGEDVAADPTLIFTPAYMPPDPLRDGSITPAADLFSLGATVQWAFTGDLPWPALPSTQVIQHIAGGARPMISPDLPEEWRPFVEAALDVRATRRSTWSYPKLISWTPGNHRDPASAKITRPTNPPPSPSRRPARAVRTAPLEHPDTTVADPPRDPRPVASPRDRVTQAAPPAAAQRDTAIRPTSTGPSNVRSEATRAALTGLAIFVGMLALLILITNLT